MPSIKVVVDSRELRSGVVMMLEKQGVEIEIITLEVGDYIANNRIAFERITIDDFLKSLYLRKQDYPRKLVSLRPEKLV